MSEFHRASDNSGTEASRPAAETGPAAQTDHEPAPDNAARQRQANAAIEARLDEAGLPTRAESRAAAGGADADEGDGSGEGDPAANTDKFDQQIDSAADAVNPCYDRAESAYSENCTGVVQAYELRRRGHDVQAGPLEKHLRTDEGGPGGRSLDVIEEAWGGRFIPGSKTEIEEAFKQPGSRGVVYIRWRTGGAHVFNVENSGGEVRFVDGQPTPARYDASRYFSRGYGTKYIRLDDRSEPPDSTTSRYLERQERHVGYL